MPCSIGFLQRLLDGQHGDILEVQPVAFASFQGLKPEVLPGDLGDDLLLRLLEPFGSEAMGQVTVTLVAGKSRND